MTDIKRTPGEAKEHRHGHGTPARLGRRLILQTFFETASLISVSVEIG